VPALARDALAGPTLDAAAALLGARLVRDDGRIGRIVEVEAYIGVEDRASHARFGPTDRNRVMWGRPGTAYVYLVYGMYDCLNVVTEPEGRPAALLIRAVEPIDGIEAMRMGRITALRGRRTATPEALAAERERVERLPDAHVARGPGLVAAAFSIDRRHTGLDLLDPVSPLRLETEDPADRRPDPVWTPRVGIAYAGAPFTELRWRLVDRSSPSVSGPRPRPPG
jgi:DNA-3-methyladenine glycosylase